MPQQELFFEQMTGDRRVAVLKTYDQSFAREAFDEMDGDSTAALATALELEKNFEPADIPRTDADDYEDFLWGELYESAREDVRSDPNLYSFFVVTETKGGKTDSLYVSPDWPSAEAFAKRRIAASALKSPAP